ncbi:Short-chain dehydrogenase reductase 1 [Zostera marina]|uniref:Short-chain dehydrogenase reductase 1 n=1 Tax=Zostera marina TaxID=29655 RepID=A0A0K9P3A9_ZOSMR|nr:Short-chain dehydrogenase reductase 1 [Zostera marina]
MSSSTSASPPSLSGRLEGKVALITGGASGIGESIARLFIKEGSKICIIDTEDSSIGKTLCADLGGDAHAQYIHGDVTIERDVQQAVDLTVAKFGGLDVMVNNAGISGPNITDIREYNMTDFNKVFDVNVNGVFLGIKHAARIMIPRRKGSIISIASVASKVGGLGSHGYAGSKHAVVGLTKNVAAEMGQHGVRVNCVSPYAIPTKLLFDYRPDLLNSSTEVLEDYKTALIKFTETCANLKGVSLSSKDVAQAVLFLACDESKYVSGLNLTVDGGFTSVNHTLQHFIPSHN